jgi:hypothetical protein
VELSGNSGANLEQPGYRSPESDHPYMRDLRSGQKITTAGRPLREREVEKRRLVKAENRKFKGRKGENSPALAKRKVQRCFSWSEGLVELALRVSGRNPHHLHWRAWLPPSPIWLALSAFAVRSDRHIERAH